MTTETPYRVYEKNGSTVYVAECCEYDPARGAWYIKMGFCGFNCRANNIGGFATKAKAEKACLKYQGK